LHKTKILHNIGDKMWYIMIKMNNQHTVYLELTCISVLCWLFIG